jgi:hypothetical protein
LLCQKLRCDHYNKLGFCQRLLTPWQGSVELDSIKCVPKVFFAVESTNKGCSAYRPYTAAASKTPLPVKNAFPSCSSLSYHRSNVFFLLGLYAPLAEASLFLFVRQSQWFRDLFVLSNHLVFGENSSSISPSVRLYTLLAISTQRTFFLGGIATTPFGLDIHQHGLQSLHSTPRAGFEAHHPAPLSRHPGPGGGCGYDHTKKPQGTSLARSHKRGTALSPFSERQTGPLPPQIHLKEGRQEPSIATEHRIYTQGCNGSERQQGADAKSAIPRESFTQITPHKRRLVQD